MKTIKKNETLVVKHILGETAKPLVTQVENGKFQFNCDAYVIGERCNGGFFHLRQAREVIPGKQLGNSIRFWPRMRKALHIAGLEPINIPGGDYPIHYYDEMVIPDYSTSGSYYFIIKRSDISHYLELLPLDESGKAHAENLEKEAKEAAERLYRWEHDPVYIAKRIGYAISHAGGRCLKGEFKKITLIADDDTDFSVICAEHCTNLLWEDQINVSKVICEAPETGIEYLSGTKAGNIDPRKHCRIKKFPLACNPNIYRAYLMPDPELATEVRENNSWSHMFSLSPELIAKAKTVILEAYDLYDNLVKERYVYDRETKSITKEYLHNWPFSIVDGKLIGILDWRKEPIN